MRSTLTVSSKQSPFPYAAISIATYTGKADLIFDDAAEGPALTLDGTKLSSEEDIVQALAKEGGLSSDSEKVGALANPMRWYALICTCYNRHHRFSLSRKHCVQ
jgi:glutamyl-tRNA synthetase